MTSKQTVTQPLSQRRSVAAILLSLSVAREREAAELRALAAALEIGADSDPLTPHDEVPGHTKRAGAEAMRAGKIAGAVKNGKKWFARRSAIEAYLASGEKPAAVTGNAVDSAIERALLRAR